MYQSCYDISNFEKMMWSTKRYRSDGIVMGNNISFVNLKATIVAELEMDERRKTI